MKLKAIHSSKVLIGKLYDLKNLLSPQPSKMKKIVHVSINSMKRFHSILPRIQVLQLLNHLRKHAGEKISTSLDTLIKKMKKKRKHVLYKHSRGYLMILIMMTMVIRAHLNKSSEFQNNKKDKQVLLLVTIKVSSSPVKILRRTRAW